MLQPLVLLSTALEPIVQTTDGPVLGHSDGNVNVFKGLPFAASTAGANRWRPPQQVEPWTQLRNATAFGPGCQQPHHNPDVPRTLSEAWYVGYFETNGLTPECAA